MSFTLANWACVSTSNNQGQETVTPFMQSSTVINSQNIFSYASPNDTVATISAANYFLPVYASLSVGDWILVNGTDSYEILAVVTRSSSSVTTISVFEISGGTILPPVVIGDIPIFHSQTQLADSNYKFPINGNGGDVLVANYTGTQHMSSGSLSVDNGSISSGGFGTTGSIGVHGANSTAGGISLLGNDNLTNNFVNITSANSYISTDPVITIPDPGASTANFILSKAPSGGDQLITVGGLQAATHFAAGGLGAPGTLTSYADNAGLQGLSLVGVNSSSGIFINISNAPFAQSSTITIPDPGLSMATFVLNAPNTINTTTVLNSSNIGQTIICTGSSGYNVTLPTPTAGATLRFIFNTSSHALVTLLPSSGTIQGQSAVAYGLNEGCMIYSDGSNWLIVQQNLMPINFLAFNGSSQSLTSGSAATVHLDHVLYDSGSFFSTLSFTYTPLYPGKYTVTGAALFNSAAFTGSTVNMNVLKGISNTIGFSLLPAVAAQTDVITTATSTVFMNGSTDALTLVVKANETGVNLLGTGSFDATSCCYLTAIRTSNF